MKSHRLQAALDEWDIPSHAVVSRSRATHSILRARRPTATRRSHVMRLTQSIAQTRFCIFFAATGLAKTLCAEQPSVIWQASAHAGAINAVAYLPVEDLLASAGDDHQV